MGSETDMSVTETAGEEKQLCIHCLFPNSLIANFCVECGAPLTSYAATGPLERILAEGHLYRTAVEKPRKPIVLFGIWILFGAMAFTSLMPLLVRGKVTLVDAILPGIVFPVCVIVIWKTTWRYHVRDSRKVDAAKL